MKLRARSVSSPACSAFIESLEQRRLLAADPAANMVGPYYGELKASTSISSTNEPQPQVRATSSLVARPDDQRVISWYVIGFSATDEAVRNIGWNLPETGWKEFVSTHVQPQIDWGVKRIMLHNPFGTLGHEDMQFSQLSQARQAGLTRITDTAEFVAAWKPVTDEGIEVIAYIGSPGKADALYADALTASGDLNRDGRVNIDDYGLLSALPGGNDVTGDGRLNIDDFAVLDSNVGGFTPTSAVASLERDSIQPLLDAGMSIALDAASGHGIDSPVYRLASRLKAETTTVYIEALAPQSATHWHNYPAMVTSWYWDNPDRPAWNVIESPVEMIVLDSEVPKSEYESAWSQREANLRSFLGVDRTVAAGATELLYMMQMGRSLESLFI